MNKDQREIQRKLRILRYAEEQWFCCSLGWHICGKLQNCCFWRPFLAIGDG